LQRVDKLSVRLSQGGQLPLAIDRILDVATTLARDGVAILLSCWWNSLSQRRWHTRIAATTGRGPANELAGSDILHSAYLCVVS
jgi:hypothetical protein